jgi:hypothetical protein
VRQSIELGNHQGRATSTNMHEQGQRATPRIRGCKTLRRASVGIKDRFNWLCGKLTGPTVSESCPVEIGCPYPVVTRNQGDARLGRRTLPTLFRKLAGSGQHQRINGA